MLGCAKNGGRSASSPAAPATTVVMSCLPRSRHIGAEHSKAVCRFLSATLHSVSLAAPTCARQSSCVESRLLAAMNLCLTRSMLTPIEPCAPAETAAAQLLLDLLCERLSIKLSPYSPCPISALFSGLHSAACHTGTQVRTGVPHRCARDCMCDPWLHWHPTSSASATNQSPSPQIAKH